MTRQLTRDRRHRLKYIIEEIMTARRRLRAVIVSVLQILKLIVFAKVCEIIGCKSIGQNNRIGD